MEFDVIFIVELIVTNIIGPILWSIGGYFAQTRNEGIKTKRHKVACVNGVIDDLEYSVDLYKKILSDYNEQTNIWHSILNELKNSRYIYAQHRDSIIVTFEDDDLRRGILRYYSKSNQCIELIDYFQSRKYKIREELSWLIKKIQHEENISYQEAMNKAIGLMPLEDEELSHINTEVRKKINELEMFSFKALEFLKKLKNIKL